MTKRLAPALAAALAAALITAAGAHAADWVRVYTLPDAAAYPEGVAVDAAGKTAYTTAVETGKVFAVDLASGAVREIGDPLGITPPATRAPAVALGLKTDNRARLWVAGGEVGSMHLVDIKTGKKLGQWKTPGAPGFINDVAVTSEAAYFTDTRRPFLYRIALNAPKDGVLEPWISFDGTPLQYGQGANLNGIQATADGRYLIVGQMAAGKLFRIDVKTKAIVQIDAGAELLTLNDGLLLKGRRLYLVRQGAGEIVALDLSADFLKAKVAGRISPPQLAWPATVGLAGDRLIVANSQLNKRGAKAAALPHTLASIPVSAFAP